MNRAGQKGPHNFYFLEWFCLPFIDDSVNLLSLYMYIYIYIYIYVYKGHSLDEVNFT